MVKSQDNPIIAAKIARQQHLLHKLHKSIAKACWGKKQDKFYNGKYKGHVVKIQVVVNNQGIPMDIQGFAPYESIIMDYLGPLQEVKGFKYVLIVKDRFLHEQTQQEQEQGAGKEASSRSTEIPPIVDTVSLPAIVTDGGWSRSEAIASLIRGQCRQGQAFETGIVLGSGLGALAEQVEERTVIPYSALRAVIPSFPVSTVAGHAGNFVVGSLAGRPVIVQQGRWHFYEGYSLEVRAELCWGGLFEGLTGGRLGWGVKDVVLGIRVLHQLGVRKLVITNAAGGVNKEFKAGQLMLIKDHINMLFSNPLFGHNDDRLGPRFPDMSHAYTPRLLDAARAAAKDVGAEESVVEGTYAAMRGPCYETPAEVRMLRKLGADAVGMSTVPEVLVAGHQGMEVVGVSCITNMAAGVLDQPLTHTEVAETANRVAPIFTSLIKAIVGRI
eukprot:m51a1_g9445 putative purine nucleoside phosphorylase (441) ;mRNA; r:462433-479219